MRRERRQYRMRLATWEEVGQSVRSTSYNQPLLIEYRGKKQMINAGRTDDITVMNHHGRMMVLSVNPPLSYAGLESVDFDKVLGADPDVDVFVSNTETFQAQAGLRKDFLDYSPNRQASILYDLYDAF